VRLLIIVGLVGVIAACSSSDEPQASCSPTADDKACNYSDPDLRRCAGAGIYGVTGSGTVCTTSNCGGAGPSNSCTDGNTIIATQIDGAGPPASATSHQGLYSLALAPGTYDVCPGELACHFAGCTPCARV